MTDDELTASQKKLLNTAQRLRSGPMQETGDVLASEVNHLFAEQRRKSDQHVEQLVQNIRAKRKAREKVRETRQGEHTVRENSTWKVARLLALGFTGLLLFGLITGNTWINALAPVGIIWSLGLPLLLKKGYLAFLGKVVIYGPTTLWICTWLVLRFKI